MSDTPTETLAVEVVQPDHTSRKHAKISPSKLNYLDPELGGCIGFESHSGTNAAAEEGTFLHEVLDKAIVDYVNGPHYGAETFESYLSTVRIRTKWEDSQDYSLRFCARVLDPYLQKKPVVHNEIRIKISDADGAEITYGHFDLLMSFGKPAVLVDYKFGIDPVQPAESNLQGLAYAIGSFQLWPELDTVGVVFIQPRLNWVSKAVFKRADIAKHIRKVKEVVESGHYASMQFERLRNLPESFVSQLNAGSACQYCARASRCPAYLRKFAVLAPRMGAPTVPAAINVESIDTPEKAAVAAFWVNFLDDKLGDIKARCMEIAKTNGGVIEFTTPEGQHIKFEVQKRSFDRVVGDAVLVSQALTQWAAPEQILGAAKLSLGKLEEIVVPAIRETQPEDERMTKKAATELLASHLEAHGLLSRPDGYTETLKRVKEKKEPKKISAKE